MKGFILFVLLSLTISSALAQSKSVEPYYIIEDFNLEQLTDSDRSILDSCLKVFHSSKKAVDKVESLSYLCDNLMDNSWRDFQAYNYTFIKRQLNLTSSKVEKQELTEYLIDALNNLSLIELELGNKSKAVELGEEAVKLAQDISYDIGIAQGYSYLGHTYFYFGELNPSLEYFKKSNKIARDQELTELIIQNETNIAQINRSLGHSDKALKSLRVCLEYYKKVKDDRSFAVCLNSIGLIHAQNGNYKKAMHAHNTAAETFKKIGDIISQATAITCVGDVYASQNEHDSALKYYTKALKISRENGDRSAEAFCMNSIANVYMHKGDFNRAKENYNASLAIEQETFNAPGIARCKVNLGKLYRKLKKYDKALELTSSGLQIYDSLNFVEEVAQSHVNMAFLFNELDKYQKAKVHADKALTIAKDLGYVKIIRSSSKLLYKIAEREGDYEKAYDMYSLHIQMRDSLLNLENRAMVIRNQIEVEERQKREKLKNAERVKRAGLEKRQNELREQRYLLMLLVLLILSIVFILMWLRSKYRLNIKWLQEDVLKSQMNPHFLSNVLVSIQSLIVQKRNKDAIEYLSEIASFMRSNLNVNSTKFISIEDEINLANQYLNLEKLRYKEKLDFTIKNNLPQDADYYVSPLILQPLLENAIVHGFKNIDYQGLIEVTIAEEAGHLRIYIDDNGVGISQTSKESSRGIKILRKRLAIANSKNRLSLMNRSDSNGVRAKLVIYS